jgi:hypothetical protein
VSSGSEYGPVKMVMNVRLEVLTAVVMKSSVFWDITQCSPLEVSRRLGGTYLLYLQGRIRRERYQSESRRLDFQRTTRRYIPEVSTPYGNEPQIP